MVVCRGMETIAIRAAEEEDLEAVRSLMRAYAAYLGANPTGAANICLTGFERELADLPGKYAAPGGVILVAWVDGRAAGCCAMRPLGPTSAEEERSGQDEERGCEMKRLWVGDNFRGLGLGRRLAEAAMEWAAGAGYGAIYLDTVPAAMPEANRMYERLGFERVGRYNDNPVADVVFFRRGLRSF